MSVNLKNQTVSERVTTLLARTGMRQEELAERLGLTSNYISQLKTGRKDTLGDLTEIRLSVMEDSPIYADRNWREKEGRQSQSQNMPPHQELPDRMLSPSAYPPESKISHQEYTEAVHILGA